MSGIEVLPDELILQITLFSSESSLAALARTNRRLQQVCTPELYRHNVLHNNSSALEWAAQSGQMDTLQKALHAGAPLPKTQARGKLREEGPPTIRFGIRGFAHIPRLLATSNFTGSPGGPSAHRPLHD
jgi:hypothetical protein